MIKRKEDMKQVFNEHMRGGDGTVQIIHQLDKGEYKGKCRLIGRIILKPGCSIGTHAHEGEEEIFSVLRGTAEYNDNGKTEILQEGDACICLGDQSHGVRNASEDDVLELFAVILLY